MMCIGCAQVYVRSSDTPGDHPCGGMPSKRIDGSDVYDEGISYKVWKISDILETVLHFFNKYFLASSAFVFCFFSIYSSHGSRGREWSLKQWMSIIGVL